jgi:purine-binding chemotaxis protein CheW
MIDHSTESAAADKYLVFELGQELFATPLIEVRSVIEFHEAKPIPHTAPYYKGVINIRGEIVGVIDLRQRLNISGAEKPDCQLVFETEKGPLAATVDKVQAVAALPESDLDRKTAQADGGEDRAYFLGVGKYQGKLLTLISLRRLAGAEKLTGIS